MTNTRKTPTRTLSNQHEVSTRPTPETRVIEWTFTNGPGQRSFQWYLIVIGISIALSGLFWMAIPDGNYWMINIVWALLLIAYANAPSRDYAVELNRDVLRVRTVKTGRMFIERNLREIATWQIEETPADRLNPLTRRVILRTRDGRNTIGLRLTGDNGIDKLVVDRISAVVPPAPDITPSIIDRIDRFAQRLIGWR